MDKLFKPERLDIDPSSTNASKVYLHWIKTFENFVSQIRQENVNKLQLLVNFVSPLVYQYIEECQTYDAAISILRSTFVKPANEIYARHLLATRRQQSGESLDEYLHVLKKLSKDCNFTGVTAVQYRDEYIRDSFITGLLSPAIRQRLLENKSLDLQTMFDQARALESAQMSMKSYSGELITSPVTASVRTPDEQSNFLEYSSCASSQNTCCYFCGLSKHVRSKCPARDQTCNKCRKKGHFARVCKNKNFSSSSAVQSSLSDIADKETDITPYLASIVGASSTLSKSTVEVKLEGKIWKALVDTGSEESFVHPDVVRASSLAVHERGKRISMAASNLSVKTHGICMVDLKIGEQSYNGVQLSVLPDLCTDMILGHDFQALHKSINIEFGGTHPPLSICGLAAMDIEPPELFANLTDDCHPIATKSRRYSEEDRKFIDLEVGKLLKEGIIENSNSPWRAQVLVARSENHKKRLVIDYSATINKFTLLDAYPLPKISDLVNTIAQYKVFSTVDLKSAYHQVRIRESDKKFTAFEANGGFYQFTRIPFGVTNGVACFQRTIDTLIREEKLTGVFPYLDDVTICGKDQVEHDKNLELFMRAVSRRGLTCNVDKCAFSTSKISILGSVIENGNIRPDPERLRPLVDLPVPKDKKSLQRAMGFFSYYSGWIQNFSEKIRPLVGIDKFPLGSVEEQAFRRLKGDIAHSVMFPIDESVPFVVETDASDSTIAATLSQGGKPVAFFSRTLHGSELAQAAVEKEAKAVVEAVRHWKHFLTYKHFSLITDQQSVSYMFGNSKKNKIKNDKIQRWKIELSCYSFDIHYRPGVENVSADALSRSCAIGNPDRLRKLHGDLCHPGVTRFYHFVRMKNLPFSLEDVKSVSNSCKTCCECKPRYHRPESANLIKATQPFERLNVDFKGPLPSTNCNKYFLMVVDEFSRYPFVFPCADMTSATIIKCFTQLFVLFGVPNYIHSDRGSSFISAELKDFLSSKGVATSRTSSYNPQGNGQCERFNGTVWSAITLALHSRNLPPKFWQVVLPDVLHSIRSLLCTATNSTPHERFLGFQRRSSSGCSIPSWLTAGDTALLKQHVRTSKTDPYVEEVTLVHVNPQYAHVRHANGKETTVSLKHLAPPGVDCSSLNPNGQIGDVNISDGHCDISSTKMTDVPLPEPLEGKLGDTINDTEGAEDSAAQPENSEPLRRSERVRRAPERLDLSRKC